MSASCHTKDQHAERLRDHREVQLSHKTPFATRGRRAHTFLRKSLRPILAILPSLHMSLVDPLAHLLKKIYMKLPFFSFTNAKEICWMAFSQTACGKASVVLQESATVFRKSGPSTHALLDFFDLGLHSNVHHQLRSTTCASAAPHTHWDSMPPPKHHSALCLTYPTMFDEMPHFQKIKNISAQLFRFFTKTKKYKVLC